MTKIVIQEGKRIMDFILKYSTFHQGKYVSGKQIIQPSVDMILYILFL